MKHCQFFLERPIDQIVSFCLVKLCLKTVLSSIGLYILKVTLQVNWKRKPELNVKSRQYRPILSELTIISAVARQRSLA